MDPTRVNIDELAERIRMTYARHELRTLTPWAAVPPHRREKWRAMARVAIEFIMEGH